VKFPTHFLWGVLYVVLFTVAGCGGEGEKELFQEGMSFYGACHFNEQYGFCQEYGGQGATESEIQQLADACPEEYGTFSTTEQCSRSDLLGICIVSNSSIQINAFFYNTLATSVDQVKSQCKEAGGVWQ